jgi:hypothetical protein
MPRQMQAVERSNLCLVKHLNWRGQAKALIESTLLDDNWVETPPSPRGILD